MQGGRPTPDQLNNTQAALNRVVRGEWGRVLAALNAGLRDISLAEDVLQDACMAALKHWPNRGMPENPAAWLLQTARRKAIDKLRRDAAFHRKQHQLKILADLERHAEPENMDEPIEDERLRMIFTCCHPALPQPARVALTLQTIGGLTAAEIARAFVVSDEAMAQRLVRAKRKIKANNIPYQVPDQDIWPERLNSVLAVVYLIFNEGYSALTGNRQVRDDLCTEAIRLGFLLRTLVCGEAEIEGLLALMLLHDSRRGARSDAQGATIMLEQQDRGLWDKKRIAQGREILSEALARGAPRPYQIQAAISAIHADAARFSDTDWHQITLLYGELFHHQPSDVVALNAAVALSYASGPAAGLVALGEIASSETLATYQPFHAARADMLLRNDQLAEAVQAYDMAISLTRNDPEKLFLEHRKQSILGVSDSASAPMPEVE